MMGATLFPGKRCETVDTLLCLHAKTKTCEYARVTEGKGLQAQESKAGDQLMRNESCSQSRRSTKVRH